MQVDDIETKVDSFIDLYMQDRMRLLSLPLHPDTSHSNNPNLPSLPPKGGGASAVITSVTTSSSGSLKVSVVLCMLPAHQFDRTDALSISVLLSLPSHTHSPSSQSLF